jgi:hypothetical protein
MLATVYQMEAEKRQVTASTLAEEMELMKRSTKAGLIFLKAINVVDASDENYRLTPIGLEYAHAVSRGSKASVKRASYSILSKSHLANIIEHLDEGNDNLAIKDMYAIVKLKAGIPDATGPFGMKSDYATGIDVLLHILQSAGIIPAKVDLGGALEEEMKRTQKKGVAVEA